MTIVDIRRILTDAGYAPIASRCIDLIVCVHDSPHELPRLRSLLPRGWQAEWLPATGDPLREDEALIRVYDPQAETLSPSKKLTVAKDLADLALVQKRRDSRGDHRYRWKLLAGYGYWHTSELDAREAALAYTRGLLEYASLKQVADLLQAAKDAASRKPPKETQ